MSTPTKRDAVNAAMSVAEDIAEGRLATTELEHQAVAELQQLVGQVVGPDDPVWPLQCDITRGVLAIGGIPTDELAEWTAVARARAGEPPEAPPEPLDLTDVPPPPESSGSGPDSGEYAAALEAEQPAVAEPTPPAPQIIPPARPGEYDPLDGWPGSRSLRG